MSSVFIVQTCKQPSRMPDWKTEIQHGIFRRREDAENAMFNLIARKMQAGIDEITEMTSTKRGKGKLVYLSKVDEITVQIPRSHRVCKLPLRDRYSNLYP